MGTPSREEAWDLFCEWTESESLRRHGLGVEAAMRAYARYPDLEIGHPRVAPAG